MISLYDRIIYHLKNRKKSKFSEGYITSAKKTADTRRFIIEQDKRFESTFLKKGMIDKKDIAFNKGFRAFEEDLKK